jgi:hypothetical protein
MYLFLTLIGQAPAFPLLDLPDDLLLQVGRHLLHPLPFNFLSMPAYFYRWPEFTDEEPDPKPLSKLLRINKVRTAKMLSAF